MGLRIDGSTSEVRNSRTNRVLFKLPASNRATTKYNEPSSMLLVGKSSLPVPTAILDEFVPRHGNKKVHIKKE